MFFVSCLKHTADGFGLALGLNNLEFVLILFQVLILIIRNIKAKITKY